MKKFIKENKSNFIKLCVILGLILIFVILAIAKNSIEFSESYSKGFGRVLFTFFAAITKYFPISATECFAVASVILVIVWIVKFIKCLKKKDIKKGISKIINIVLLGCAVLTTYTATMEVQYNRKEVPIPLYKENVDKSEFVPIIEHFLNDYNLCASKLEFKDDGNIVSPYSISEMNRMLAKEFKRLNAPEFNNYFAKFTTNVKPMMSSAIYSELQITGLTFGCLGEANINTAAPVAGIPLTMAHELAHTKGVLREDDANLVAIYLMLTSEDYFFRFSGYYFSFYKLLSLGGLTGNKQDLAMLNFKMDPMIHKNDNYGYKYWNDHDLLGKIGDFFNDLYLKSSGTEGTSSYNDTPTVVDPVTEIVITFSKYQQLYFGIYYR